MKFPIEKFNSNFIPGQFPDFYEEDGIDFVGFLQLYYEWAESQKDITSGNPNFIAASRNLFDYRDIDNTLEQFLSLTFSKNIFTVYLLMLLLIKDFC